jgi:hypothetical protein
MGIVELLAIGGACAAAYMGSGFLAGLNKRVDSRQETAIKLGQWLSENGLPAVAELTTRYAVRDLTGLVSSFRQIAATLDKPESAKPVIQSFLFNQLDKQLATEKGQKELISYIEDKLSVKIDRTAIAPKVVELSETSAEVVS